MSNAFEEDTNMTYTVYILECSDKSYYVGSTFNIEQRLADHRKKKAAAWTAKRLPVKLVYTETHPTQLSASRREQQIKRWTRSKKEKLINGEWGNPSVNNPHHNAHSSTSSSEAKVRRSHI